MIDELEIRHFNPAEMLRERIDPESVGMFWVADGHVAGKSLIEAIAGEQSKGRSEALLSM